MAPRTVYANLADGLNPFNLFDQSFADTDSRTVVPCAATGTNALALTPVAAAYAQAVSLATFYGLLTFVAPATSTGPVTVAVAGLPALKAYKSSTDQASTGDLTANTPYQLLYSAALNSGAGGFYLLGASAQEANYTPEQYGAVGDGIANDTAALVAFFGAAAGNAASMRAGAVYLTDPISISQTGANAPTRLDGNGATIKARASSASALVTFENIQGLLKPFVVSHLKLNAAGLHAYPMKIHGSQHAAFRDIDATGGTSGGAWLSGEPGFGIYYTTLDSINSHDNTGSGFIFKSVNNSGSYYIAAECLTGLRSINNTSYGYDLDYASIGLFGCEAETNTLGGFNIDHSIQVSVLDAHIEGNGGTAIAFIGTANTKNLKVAGGRTIGTITGSLLTDASNSWNTADVSATPIIYVAGNKFVSAGLAMRAASGIGLSGSSAIADSINAGVNGTSFLTSGSIKGAIVSGMVLGAPTGGDLGTGFLNAAGGVSINNSPVAVLASPVFTGTVTAPTLAGGAAAGSTLTLESTSGAGTTDAIAFQTGSQIFAGGINTSQQWIVGPNLAPATGVLLTLNKNTVVVNTPPLGTLLHVQGADATKAAISFDGFGTSTYAGFNLRAARGTAATPTATTSGDILGYLQWSGYNSNAAAFASFTAASGASVAALAAETWSGATTYGAHLTFKTTPTSAGQTATEAGRFSASGGLSVGTTTDAGIGNVLTSGFFSSGGDSRVASDFTVTSSVAPVNVTGLTSTVVAGKTYGFQAVLFTTSNIGGGVQAAIAGTATATSVIYEGETTAAAAVGAQTRAAALATSVGGVTAVTAARIDIIGSLTVNAGGTLTVQFAQNTSNITGSVVKQGSWFKVWQIA